MACSAPHFLALRVRVSSDMRRHPVPLSSRLEHVFCTGCPGAAICVLVLYLSIDIPYDIIPWFICSEDTTTELYVGDQQDEKEQSSSKCPFPDIVDNELNPTTAQYLDVVISGPPGDQPLPVLTYVRCTKKVHHMLNFNSLL
jgi:hypothetical protein